MFAYEQRLETACFERVRQFAHLDPVVGWEMESANQHDYTSTNSMQRTRTARIILRCREAP
jgi:hypothetical protein